jgi:hypothetical protein
MSHAKRSTPHLEFSEAGKYVPHLHAAAVALRAKARDLLARGAWTDSEIAMESAAHIEELGALLNGQPLPAAGDS